MPIAAESILLGQLGEIKAGQEIPSTYPGTMGDEVKTDFKRLKALGLIADEKASNPVPVETPAAPEPTTPVTDDDDLPEGVVAAGGGWYEVDGRRVRGRDAAIAAAQKD